MCRMIIQKKESQPRNIATCDLNHITPARSRLIKIIPKKRKGEAMKVVALACAVLFASLAFAGFSFRSDRQPHVTTDDRQHICRLIYDQFIDTCGTDGPLNPQ
jgi:hypothetical protein